MLIEAPYKKNDTVTLKTSGGEEIIARFVEENDNTVKVQKPMTLVATPDGNIGLGPFAFTLNQGVDVVLNKNVILMIAKTEQEMASQYVQSTTGLAL